VGRHGHEIAGAHCCCGSGLVAAAAAHRRYELGPIAAHRQDGVAAVHYRFLLFLVQAQNRSPFIRSFFLG